jgi:hypothetical protein
MTTMQQTFKPGDRVRVVDLHYSPRQYPFLPDLIGWVGTVVSEQYPADGEDAALYLIKFDKTFQVGVVPPGETAFGYEPTEWVEGDDYTLGGDELELADAPSR